jgi:hypothetical protein
MNKLTKFTFAASVNAICLTVALGLAAVAMGSGVPCNQETTYTCDDTCDGATIVGSFNCCSTYGIDCCRRLCSVANCVDAENGTPCNTQNQAISTAGTTDPYGTCTSKGTCLP